MLASTLFWYGKLPHQPEFLSSNTDNALQTLIQTWIVAGQNHIGAALLGNASLSNLYGYGFLLQNHVISPKLGVLLTSQDSLGRNFPFIIIQDATIPLELFLAEIKNFFTAQAIDLSQYYSSLNTHQFFNQLEHVLADLQAVHTYHAQNKMDYWIECYPNASHLKLSVEKLTPILYRKLMLRGNS